MTQAFVYKWTELSTKKWYIGSRTRKNCHINDGYICSSKIVLPLIKSNPNNWKREILEIGSPEDMVKLETELLVCLDAAKSEFSYNQTNGSGKFSNAGRTPSAESNAKRSASLKGKNKGPKSYEHRAKISNSLKDKPQSVETRAKKSASMKGKNKGKKHTAETRAKRSTSMKGKNKGPKPKFPCPHCGKECDAGNLAQWHGDNCKMKINK